MFKFLSNIWLLIKGDRTHNTHQLKFGCFKDTEDDRDYKKEFPTKVGSAHSTFSLRKYIAGGILNQKSTSACTGYAGAYALSILINRQIELSAKDQNYKFSHVSPTYIYYNARLSEGFSTKTDEGSTIRSIMKALKNPGAVDISVMGTDYSTTKEPPKNINDLPKYTITSYFRIEKNENTIELMQRVLDTELLPIVCGVMLYEEQTDNAYYNGGILDYSNIKNDTKVGGHAICLTGYKYINGKLYFELCNSWGTLWGNNGFGYIPADMVTSDDMLDIWTFDKRYF